MKLKEKVIASPTTVATALSKLPTVITELFDEKRFSHGNAETLLALVRTLGVSKVARNAKLLSEQPGRRSAAAILNYLAGGPSDTDCKVKVHVTLQPPFGFATGVPGRLCTR